MNKIITFSFCLLIFVGCLKEGAITNYNYYSKEDFEKLSKVVDIPSTPYEYNLELPEYASAGFFAGAVNNAEVTLGRVLFYDKNLSKDKKVSCASCHDQKLGFADSKAFSDGSNGKVTTRNSLALASSFNFSVYYGDERFGRVPFFWDNSATTVQEQSERTLKNPNEMDMHIDEVTSRVKESDYYGGLFEKAYKTRDISGDRILDAISAFVNAIPAFNTKWDRALNAHYKKKGSTTNLVNYDFALFSNIENKGKNIYLNKCASCHGETFGAPSKTRANNGLEMAYTDEGIGKNTGLDEDYGKFKVPTLRNILLTAPYMHDGSLKTIDDVLEHYSQKIDDHKNLDKELKSANGKALKMNFTSEDKEALKAFFETLTDYELMTDVRFSDPFKK